MALKVWLVAWAAAALFALPAPASAQNAGTAAPAESAAGTAAADPATGEALVPPVAATDTTIVLPADAPELAEPVTVTVTFVVSKDGLPLRIELLPPPPDARREPVLEAEVLRRVAEFVFVPGRFRGKPVAVRLRFVHTFLPRPRPVEAARSAVLQGRLIEKGTRLPVAGASLQLQVAGERIVVDADRRGRFAVRLPPGRAVVAIAAPGCLPFHQQETLAAGETLTVAYYLEKERYDPYEIVVVADKRRTELSRQVLRGPELRQVPGTFGDPLRVIQSLPGVASVVSLLPYPIVRGASPGNTGFLIDGVRVPLLFHLLAGPSVLHPEFIDEVQFHAGGFPVQYGGYTAGILDGKTRKARSGERRYDADLNLLQAGAFVRHPLSNNLTATAAARVGYPGMVLSLATDQASLSYWDYQLRLDSGDATKGFTVFAFGASDELLGPAPGSDPTKPNPPLVPVLRLGFHRLDLRGQRRLGRVDASARVVGGMDQTLSGSAGTLTTLTSDVLLRANARLTRALDLHSGVDLQARDTDTAASSGTRDPTRLGEVTAGLRRLYSAGVFAETLWRPTPNWLWRLGLRGDARNDEQTSQLSADPRLAVRYRLTSRSPLLPDLAADVTTTTDREAVWLKAGVGVYHQPPRLFLPLPGLDTLPLRYGLLRAVQSSVGLELPVGPELLLSSEAFFNYMNPVVFDVSVNPDLADVLDLGPSALPGQLPADLQTESLADRVLGRLVTPQQGRSYGLELMLRREARQGPYGWIAYTLSASERRRDGSYVPFDFDRTHLLNLVVGLPLARNWDVGARLQYQSGKPATTTLGYNAARMDGYVRVDLRVDKRVVWNQWLLDFYVDLTNAALFPEEVNAGQVLRYVLPTVGVRGRL